MKKIMFTGLGAEVTESAVRESLEKIGPVNHVDIYREGNEAAPVVVVEMAISDAEAFSLTTRVKDLWHNGHLVNARLLLH
jgi:hypothetical protein